MYKDDLSLTFARFEMGEEWSERRVAKVFSFMIRQKDSSNRVQVTSPVIDLFDTNLKLVRSLRPCTECGSFGDTQKKRDCELTPLRRMEEVR